MSEILKNIETCRGEDVLAEVSALTQDPHFGSLVNEALDPLKQQAAAQAGYDGYSEVIDQHKPYTFASFIVQMKSNLLLLLRALWQFPFGSGTLRSLSDMWQHYITRLSGNPEHGIPSRLSSLTDLPSAPLLLADRKISGVPDAEDGISLVQLICASAASNEVLELADDTTGWTCDKSNVLQTLMSVFSSARTFTLGCKKITAQLVGEFDNNTREYNIHFPWLTELSDLRLIADEYENRNPTFNVYVESLRHTNQTSNTYTSFFCKRLYAPVYESGVFRQGGSGSYGYTYMRYMLFGCTGAKNTLVRIWSYTSNNGVTDFEIGDKEYIDAGKTPRWLPCQSITLTGFDSLTAENMYNHILCRLKQDEANCGDGVTITLGSTNIAKLEAVEEYNTLLTELEDVYGYTFA